MNPGPKKLKGNNIDSKTFKRPSLLKWLESEEDKRLWVEEIPWGNKGGENQPKMKGEVKAVEDYDVRRFYQPG